MIALMGFFVVHLSMVALTGVWNNVRSMITGWFVVEPELAFSTTAVNTSPVSTPPFEAPPVDAPPSPAAEGEST
jgi:hypothetical protein